MLDVFFSVEEVSKKMDVHPRTVRRYIASGELPANRAGKKWVVRKEDLTVFINDRNPLSRHHHGGIKQDDLCVFMDKVKHHPSCRIQICSVVDVRASSEEETKDLVKLLESALKACEPAHCFEAKMQYVFNEKGQKMRFVIWGSPDIIATAMKVFGENVDACD